MPRTIKSERRANAARAFMTDEERKLDDNARINRRRMSGELVLALEQQRAAWVAQAAQSSRASEAAKVASDAAREAKKAEDAAKAALRAHVNQSNEATWAGMPPVEAKAAEKAANEQTRAAMAPFEAQVDQTSRVRVATTEALEAVYDILRVYQLRREEPSEALRRKEQSAVREWVTAGKAQDEAVLALEAHVEQTEEAAWTAHAAKDALAAEAADEAQAAQARTSGKKRKLDANQTIKQEPNAEPNAELRTRNGLPALTLNGSTLEINKLVEYARDLSLPVKLGSRVARVMKHNREITELIAARGDVVYGLSTGVGVRKQHGVGGRDMVQFQERMVREHATGQGGRMDPVVVRGAAICLLNSLCAGKTCVRYDIANRIADRLSNGVAHPLRDVPKYGSTGMGDVTPLAHISRDLVYLATGGAEGTKLQAGEALPLIAQSSVVTSHAAVAITEAKRLLSQLHVLCCLDVEGYAANPAPYNQLVSECRPHKGYRQAIDIINSLLKGGELFQTDQARQRHLQSPLTFRTAAGVLGAASDALEYSETQVGVELNAHQQNPMPISDNYCGGDNSYRMNTTGHFDMQALSQAMDVARLALAPCLTAQIERSVKMLQSRDTGLPDGLADPKDDGAMGHGLSEILWPLQAMGAEARLIAVQMVSAEVGSGGMAEGVEDRLTMAALSAERLRKFVNLASRCVAISLTIACQAIDLRGCKLSPLLRQQHAQFRKLVPVMGEGDAPPESLEAVVCALMSNELLTCELLGAAAEDGGDEDETVGLKLRVLNKVTEGDDGGAFLGRLVMKTAASCDCL